MHQLWVNLVSKQLLSFDHAPVLTDLCISVYRPLHQWHVSTLTMPFGATQRQAAGQGVMGSPVSGLQSGQAVWVCNGCCVEYGHNMMLSETCL